MSKSQLIARLAKCLEDKVFQGIVAEWIIRDKGDLSTFADTWVDSVNSESTDNIRQEWIDKV